MTEHLITQGDEDPADTAARRAAWNSRVIVLPPLTVEDLFTILKGKGIVSDDDKPGNKP